MDEVGVDAARYSLIRYPADSPLTLDLDLLVKRTNDNPVFYVQYAHARISSVLRHAATSDRLASAPFDASLLGEERERDLIGVIADLPRVVGSAASCASRTGSRATWRSSPTRTTSSTTPAGCCRAATRS